MMLKGDNVAINIMFTGRRHYRKLILSFTETRLTRWPCREVSNVLQDFDLDIKPSRLT